MRQQLNDLNAAIAESEALALEAKALARTCFELAHKAIVKAAALRAQRDQVLVQAHEHLDDALDIALHTHE